MKEQIAQLINRLVIPHTWYATILAYYVSDDGMSHFERQGYNLRQQLARYQELYERGHLTSAQFEQRSGDLVRQLQQLKPEAQAETAALLPLLQDFPALWKQLSIGGQRNLLKTMFAGLYFADSRLRRALAHEPFGELLGLPGNGMME